jgi:hypothetical protein
MKIKAFKYSENFCEENIWHLCQNPELKGFTKKVLIISNSNRNCSFRFQKSPNGDEVVWWDYHVILLAFNSESRLIYDFDSTLEFPSSFNNYLDATFQADPNQDGNDLPGFKSIASEDFIHSFISDRGHMKDDQGNWLSSPPKWPTIGNKGKLPLPELLDFSETSKERIWSLEEMYLGEN